MWKKLNYFYYKQNSNLTSELYFKLYLNRDKSKKIDIQITPNSTLDDVFNNFRIQIESNATKIDPETQEYKFILLDKTNKYNKFIIKKNFLLYNYMHEEKYELYYIPVNKKKSYTISLALKEKNSYQNEKTKNSIYDSYPLEDQLIKKDSAYKYSKKLQKFVPINIYLHRDTIELEKIKSSKFPIQIPLSSIQNIQEMNDITFKQEYLSMVISSYYNSKNKKYIIALNSKNFDNWLLTISHQLHHVVDTKTSLKLNNELNELNKKRTSLIYQITEKVSNIKGVLSLKFSKEIFYEFYENKEVKELYDLMILLRDDILNKKKLIDIKDNINKIINIIETNNEFNFELNNKSILGILKQNMDKINSINNNDIININEVDKNNININIKNEENNKFVNESIIYSFIDHLILKYFEPRFNNIMGSELKSDFMNKILDYVIKNQNKEDYKFFDFNSNIKELIITQ